MPFSEAFDDLGAAPDANRAPSSPVTGFWSTTPGSTTHYWSPEMFDLLGCCPSAATPTAATWLASVHPDDRAAVAALWENPGAEMEAVLFRVVQPSGRVRPLTARRHAASTGDGAPATIMGMVQQRTPQEPLQERLRMFESVVVNANDAVVITEGEPLDGPEGPRIVYVNEAFLRNTGYTADEVIGQTPRMFQGPDTDRATLDKIRTALERWEPVRAELLNYRKDGSPFWVEVEIVPVADGDGWYTHWVSVQRDVTERKDAEQRLEVSERRFRNLVSNLPGLIYRAAYEDTWEALYLSEGIHDISGYPPEVFVGGERTFRELIHSDDLPRIEAEIVQAIATQEPYEVEYRIRHRDGSLRWVLDAGQATFDADQATRYLDGVLLDITDRKEAEQRFKSLTANLPGAIFRADPRTWHAVYTSESVLDLSGYSHEAFSEDHTFADLVHPDDRPQVEAEATEALSKGQPFQIEYRINHRDGSLRWVLAQGQLIPDADPQNPLIDGLVLDITERKAAEQRLEASEQRFRSLVTNLPGLVYRCTYDTAWDTLYMSEGILEISGYTRKEFEDQERSFKDIVVPDDLPRIRAAVRASITAGQAYEIEYRMRHRDGTTRWVLDKGQAMIDENGDVAWLDGVMFDITARKEAEERLRLMETAVEDTTESVLITDTALDRPGPRIVHVNPGFERLTGYTAEEAIGQTPRILQGEETDPALLAHLREQLEAGEQFFGETVNYRKDGTPFINEWSISPARNDKGEITHFVAVQRDVTERRQYEKRIREALGKERELSDLKTQFISMTSHEFRTPMGTILASAELLERYGARWEHDKQITHLQRIQSAVHTMRDLLDDVLVIGRSDAGKLTMRPEQLDPTAVIGAIVDEVRHGQGGQHTITLDTDEAPAAAVADAGLIRHACTNLLSNAIKYSDPGSTVRVRVWAADEALHVRVADDGIGIPEGDQERLFESFHRAGNVGDVSGTGLGLAIVQRAVAAHGGQVDFDSEVGVGSTFHITLPLNPQDSA
ncbi:MAG: PAS domain S-box protein [Bacteroidetes bacterium]|jgi:PAS domain S-box-containing protein|nr:PAS domain S-box protein [Bacteroidota bacterium]